MIGKNVHQRGLRGASHRLELVSAGHLPGCQVGWCCNKSCCPNYLSAYSQSRLICGLVTLAVHAGFPRSL